MTCDIPARWGDLSFSAIDLGVIGRQGALGSYNHVLCHPLLPAVSRLPLPDEQMKVLELESYRFDQESRDFQVIEVDLSI